MAHSVTIRTQTVRTNSSAIVMNTGYLQSWSGVLRLLQLILEIICVGIIGHYIRTYYISYVTAFLFFLIVISAFMIGNFILLLSFLISFSTASVIPKTIYELLYHSTAFGLILAASVVLLVKADEYREWKYELVVGASVCGIICAALYFISSIISFRVYKTI